MTHEAPNDQPVSREELVQTLLSRVNSWNFEAADEQDNGRFITQIAFWAFEVFAQQNSDGEYHLYQDFHYGEGFKHDELPDELKSLVATESYGEIYYGQNNTVRMVSTVETLETEPYIPKWDEISQLPTYQERLDAIINDPEVLGGLIPSFFQVIPGVSIVFQPDTFYDWGLKIHADQTDLWIAPFGAVNKTKAPFEFARSIADQQATIARIAANLVYLCVKYASTYNRDFIVQQLDHLDGLIFGTDEVDISRFKLVPNPGNSIPNLMIKKALERSTDS